MKHEIMKRIPLLAVAVFVATIGFILDGWISIEMMNAIDTVIDKDRELFIQRSLRLMLAVSLLVPSQLLLAYLKGLYKKSAITGAKKHFLKQIFKKDIRSFQSDNNAEYLSCMTNDVKVIESDYIDGLFEIYANVMNFIVGIVVIAYVSVAALGVGILLGVMGMVVSMVMGKPLEKQQKQRSEFYKDYTIYIKEFLGAFQIIKSYGLHAKVKDDFHKKSEHIQERGYQIDRIVSYISATQNFLMMGILYSLMAFSVFLTLKGALTLGGVILIINNMEKILRPLMTISEWLPKLNASKGIFKRIDDLLMIKPSEPESVEINDFKSELTFDQVSFSFEENVVFDETSFRFDKGKKYLVVGPSGGGKSTMLRLIRKYFHPKEGIILLDGTNLNDIIKESYFEQLSNIEQQVFIFEDTIRNNLCLYKEISDAEIWSAIERAGLTQFVKSHAEGLDRMLYDNGKNISGGEKSRLAIARGLLQNAKIIILDEAFSSLDRQTAKQIEKTLLTLEEVTIINVSHVIFEESKALYDATYLVKNQKVSLVEA